MTDADLGKRIVSLRTQANVSQLELCRKIGRSRGWIRRREQGKMALTPTDLFVLSRALRVPIDIFVFDPS